MTNFEKFKKDLTVDFFTRDGSPWTFFYCEKCPALEYCKKMARKDGDQCRAAFYEWSKGAPELQNTQPRDVAPICSENFETWAKSEHRDLYVNPDQIDLFNDGKQK